MPQARGSGSVVALFEETTYATAPGAPNGTKLYVVSSALQASQPLVKSNTLGGNRARTRSGRGNINAGGPIKTELSAENVGTLLKHAMGAVSTSGVGPYTHTLTLGNLPVGLHIEHDYGAAISGAGRYERFKGKRVSRASFRFPSEGLITADFDMMGAGHSLESTPLDATLNDNGHTPFSAFQASITEGGSAIATVTDVTLDIDNEPDGSVYAIGGAGTRRALPEGFSTVSGTLTALFEDAALLNKAINDTASSLAITCTRGTGLGSAGNESIVFTVQDLVYERTSPAIEGPAGLKISMKFEAFRSGANNGLQVVIKNALSAI